MVQLPPLVVLLALQAATGHPTASPPKSLEQLREDVHPLVSAYCGKCHSPASPKVMDGAVKAFDSNKPDWAARLSKGRR